MQIKYRQANAEDAEKISEAAITASGGISEFLLHDLFPNTTIKDILKLVILNEKNPMSYNNTLVAEYDGEVIAAANYYPSKAHGVPNLMKEFLPENRILHMKNFYDSRVPDSLYIHMLAVLPDYRYTSAAMDLLYALKKIAITEGLSCLSAHVWADNLMVLKALEISEFTIQEKVPVERHALLPHDGGMLLMKGPALP